MRRSTLLLLALLPAATPAAAQWFDGPRGPYLYNAPPPPYGYGGPVSPRILPRDVIVDRLEEQGFDEVGRPRLDGDVYTVEALSPAGSRVRLVVDAYRGSVMRRVGLGNPRFDGFDEDLPPAPGRRSAGRPPPSDEMPNAPRFREDPRLSAREDADLPPPGTRIAPASPVEAVPLAPPSQLARPADPRLAPDGPAAMPAPAQPRREAARPVAPESSDPSPSPTGVYGVNPDRAKPAAAAKPRPPKPAATTSPPDPAPVAGQPAPSGEAKATADAGPRKPVRVIQGVTPMQASPAPQNQVQGTPPAR